MEDVPFAVIENVPIFPGCEKEKGRTAQTNCMNQKITQFIQRRFNTDLGSQLGLRGIQQIMVVFTIDVNGEITNIMARGPHSRLESEARSVVEKLPKMQQGSQRGKKVPVTYTLPIRFEVQ